MLTENEGNPSSQMKENRSGSSKSGWTGGSSQSIYATPSSDTPSPIPVQSESAPAAEKRKNAKPRYSVKVTHRSKEKSYENEVKEQPRQLKKSRSGLSLSERLGIDCVKQSSIDEPMPDSTPFSQSSLHNDADRVGKASKLKPSNLRLQDRISTDVSASQSPTLKTPLSATHPLPKTPLKHEGRALKKKTELTPAPASELKMYNANMRIGSIPKGGLLLDAGGGDPVLPQELQTPGKEIFRTNLLSDMSQDQSTSRKFPLPIDQMVAELRLSHPPPAEGTQESRWAVKTSDEEKMKMGREEVGKRKVLGTALNSSASNLQEREIAPTYSAKSNSLFNRISPAKDTLQQSVKKGDTPRESREGSRDLIIHENQRNTEALHIATSIDFAPITSSDDKSLANRIEDMANGHMDISKDMSEFTSATSFTANAFTETSHTGNDTVTSINWADDDDELPDLPEDWTRASQHVDTVEDGSNTITSSSPPSNQSLNSIRGKGNEFAEKLNEIGKRGAKRGGKGRSKRNHDESISHNNSDTKGLQIAGSVNRGEAAKSSSPLDRKELFPSYKEEAAQSSKGLKSEGASSGRNEPRLHGRPKLAAGSKDAFDRLTRGAISVKSSNSKQAKKGVDGTSRLQAGSVAHGSNKPT